MESENNPLVSIIVITYNSAKYVLETLESAKDQFYQNIELIVSDDGSTDDTVEICREWIENNKKRFVRTALIAHPVNTGISANCNRGVKAAQGEWVKLIAGDDVLLPEAVFEYIKFINPVQTYKVYFSKLILFGEKIDQKKKLFWEECYNKFSLLSSIEMKLKQLKFHSNFLPAAASFIKKDLFSEVGGFDEDIALLEDRPFWIRCLQNGYQLILIDRYIVKYRLTNTSIQSSVRMQMAYSIFTLKYIYQKPLLTKFFVFGYHQLKERSYTNKILLYKYSLILKILKAKEKMKRNRFIIKKNLIL